MINFNKIDDETIKEHGYVLISIDEVDPIPSTLNLIFFFFWTWKSLPCPLYQSEGVHDDASICVALVFNILQHQT